MWRRPSRSPCIPYSCFAAVQLYCWREFSRVHDPVLSNLILVLAVRD